jgi:hypothetical protein
MIAACHELNLDAELTWVGLEQLAKHGVQLWQELPLALPPGRSSDALMSVDNAKAIEAGLRFRSWSKTAGDTLAWKRSLSDESQPRHGLDKTKESDVLRALSLTS